MSSESLHAVILAGGSGTRFWPASRRARPKQFLAIAGEEPLLVATLRRIEGAVPPDRTWVVTAREQAEDVRRLCPELPAENVLAEPAARNTAACAAWAALEVAKRDPGAVLALLPADHVVSPAERFRAFILAAAELAAREPVLVTFGVRPTFAATGYGYIESGALTGEARGEPVHAVTRFIEKPDAARAAEFLASGRFLWNSGLFVWSARTILAAFERHAPDVLAPLRDARTPEHLERVYPTLPSLPVDIAILERAEGVRMIPVDYAWSDVGSWSSIPDVHAADAAGNCVVGGGALVAEDARDCVVYGDAGGLTALIGVEGLVVVQAQGVTLVCPRERAQDVKRIVERLASEDPRWL